MAAMAAMASWTVEIISVTVLTIDSRLEAETVQLGLRV